MDGLCRTGNNRERKYPRLIAHRGLSWAMPENTVASFAAAIALGADEIEFDLWATKDDQLVVCHDSSVDRTSNGSGEISSLRWDEIKDLDAGSWKDEIWTGLRFSTFEDILRLFGRRVIFNIHIKGASDNANAAAQGGHSFQKRHMEQVVSLIRKYDCEDWGYIAGDSDILQLAIQVDESIQRCSLCGCFDYTIVDAAIKYGCKKLQFLKPYYNQEMIEKAHRHGITCNMFWSDDPEEAKKFLEEGIDSILTNRFNLLKDII